MTRTATRFPYTALFRSRLSLFRGRAALRLSRGATGCAGRRVARLWRRSRSRCRRGGRAGRTVPLAAGGAARRRQGDRRLRNDLGTPLPPTLVRPHPAPTIGPSATVGRDAPRARTSYLPGSGRGCPASPLIPARPTSWGGLPG